MKLQRLGREWEWPDGDQKCWHVVFDEVKEVKKLSPHLKGRRTAIQAGGNMGVFAWALAKMFDYVIAAEPDPDCFPFLVKNTLSGGCIQNLHVAFMDAPGDVHIENDHPGNMGAQFVRPGGFTQAITIDGLAVPDCDLIMLDIEGAELLALKGAQQTIELTKPLICVEEKGLGSRYGYAAGDIALWLSQFGYRAVARSKRDVMYATV